MSNIKLKCVYFFVGKQFNNIIFRTGKLIEISSLICCCEVDVNVFGIYFLKIIFIENSILEVSYNIDRTLCVL